MVHVSETCEPTAPHLLTHVHTTTAAVHEAQCTAPIHQALGAKDLPPSEHLVDAAYIDAELLVSRQRHGITLRGPARPNPTGKPKSQGHTRWPISRWIGNTGRSTVRRGKPRPAGPSGSTPRAGHIQVRFHQHDCRACDVRALLHTGDAGRPYLDTPPASGI